jgi:hypothetical protein
VYFVEPRREGRAVVLRLHGWLWVGRFLAEELACPALTLTRVLNLAGHLLHRPALFRRGRFLPLNILVRSLVAIPTIE